MSIPSNGAVVLPQGFIQALQSERITAPFVPILRDTLAATKPVTAIRFNPARRIPDSHRPEWLDNAVPVPWCGNAFVLRCPDRPSFTLDPLLHQGAYYVQDPSSMAIGIALDMAVHALGHRPLTMLDACAAPGGKSTLALTRLPEGSLLVANEFVGRRADILHENLAKWGNPNVLTASADTAVFARSPHTFDIILSDVPCSGEGMMRKDAYAREQWTPALVAECAALQRSIVSNLWPALKPGGFLIYSTCTFNATENEHNVDYIVRELGAEQIPLSSQACGGATDSRGALRFIPGMVEGEGQFIALLRKPEGEPEVHNKKRKPTKSLPTDVLKHPSDFVLTADGPDNVIQGWPVKAFELPDTILKICRPVLRLGTSKSPRKPIVPAQELALNTALLSEAYTTVDVDKDTAIEYLKRQAVTLDQAPRGYLMLRYANLPLGFVNNIGNRANNLYPTQWRITTTYI